MVNGRPEAHSCIQILYVNLLNESLMSVVPDFLDAMLSENTSLNEMQTIKTLSALMVNYSHMVADHFLQKPLQLERLNKMFCGLTSHEYSRVSNLSVQDTKIMVCGLSKFYYCHLTALVYSKTEKRKII